MNTKKKIWQGIIKASQLFLGADKYLFLLIAVFSKHLIFNIMKKTIYFY